MHIIKGYVWVAKALSMEVLFGKGIPGKFPDYANLESNGLVPFETIRDAYRVLLLLRERRDIWEPKLARISMRVAEIDTDLDALRKSRSLVVVFGIEGGPWLLGRLVEGKPSAHPIPGAYLCANGLKPFNSFADAEHSATQAKRQAGSSVTIASFYLKRL